MGDLVLDSLEIKGFRAFRDLKIERLGRVNLIVGKNNTGKTSLLEALRLYAARGFPPVIWQLLYSRDETSHFLHADSAGDTEDSSAAARSLFHDRSDILSDQDSIQVGPIAQESLTLKIHLGWYAFENSRSGALLARQVASGESKVARSSVLGLHMQLGDKELFFAPLDTLQVPMPREVFKQIGVEEINGIFVPAHGLSAPQSGALWTTIVLTDYEQDVIRALQVIAPDVERANVVQTRRNGGNALDVVPIVRVKGASSPVPLRSLGEGMNRMFGLALSLVSSRNGLLLIDEIESGLHYSVQPHVWRLIFETARRLNVQVFATTHSWDCVQAFQNAAREDQQEEGYLIRLREKQGEIVATLFDEADLAIVAEQQIEVR
jgi:ABC-type transport system involved in cytochrome c biogenesis ATPase subunit